MQMLRDGREWIIAGEGHAAGSQFVEHNAERVKISATINDLAERLFRRHVSRGADDRAGM